MGSGVRVEFNDANLGKLCRAEEARQEVRNATGRIAANANALGAGYRTGLYHRDHKSPAVGNTQPNYAHDVQDKAHTSVGIAYTGNYAAMKDNMLHNTLLKAVR